MRRIDDIKELRKNIFEFIRREIESLEPQELNNYVIKFENVDYPKKFKNFEYSPQDELNTLLNNKSLTIPLKADVVLYDKLNNKELQRKRIVVADVPYLRDRGTFIINGINLSLANQLRLKPGIYTKISNVGDVVTMINPEGSQNSNFILDVDTGIFYLKLKRGSFPLLPILKEIGMSDEELKLAFGEFYNRNKELIGKRNLEKFTRIVAAPGENYREKLKNLFLNSRVDPVVTSKTIGIPVENLNNEAIIATIQKMINVRNGVDPGDSRDDLVFQRVVTPAYFLAESIRFSNFELRKKLFKALMKKDLKFVRPKIFNNTIDASFRLTSLGQVLQDINPSERIDQIYRITRIGRGSIEDIESATLESRSVHPTFVGFIDPLQTPEQEKIGLDVRLTRNVFVDDREGILFREMVNAKTKKRELIPSTKLMDYVIAFPGEMERNSRFVKAIRGGKLDIVDKKEVDYYLDKFEEFFGPTSFFIPMQGSSFPQRISMGSRMKLQALPLLKPEIPNVMSGVDNVPAESLFEKMRGIVRSDIDGVVSSINDKYITIKGDSGIEKKYPIISLEPNNNKTGFYHKTDLKKGQRVKKGDVVLYTNFSSPDGLDSYGVNAKIAYMPYYGLNYEDAFVISESFAKKLTSEHFYQEEFIKDEDVVFSKSKYMVVFPNNIKDPKILSKYNDNGIIMKGQILEPGDPIIMAFVPPKKLRVRKGDRLQNIIPIDRAIFWDHNKPGKVVDIIEGKDFLKIIVRTEEEMEVGDKMAGRYGDKGVVSAIIPDEKMLKDEEGNTIDVIISPASLPSRGNVSQIFEAVLGKIAEKTGKRYVVPSWNENGMNKMVEEEKRKSGIKDKETVYDPISGKYIENVLVGNRYMMKLHITSESKVKGRNIGRYTLEQMPAKGGKESARVAGILDINSLISHGAYENLMEMKLIKSQRQDNFWTRIMMGLPPIVNEQNFVFEKFLEMIKASGINPVYRNEQINLFALTKKDIDELTKGRTLTNTNTVDWNTEDLKPIEGGLFDKTRTGGHGGRLWSKIDLDAVIPSPVMEKVFVKLLNINNNQFLEILSGKREIESKKYKLENKTGIEGLKEYFSKFNIDEEIKEASKIVDSPDTPISKLNENILKLKYLYFMKNSGQHPSDWFWDSVPVLPPIFRPVAVLPEGGIPIIEDVNFLYSRVFESNKIYKENKNLLGGNPIEEYINLYKSVAALVGTYDPIGKYERNKEIVGILKFLFGKRGKIGFFQRKVIGSTLDYSGQAVITPDPNMSIDEIGIPENLAWEMYKMFVLKNLKIEKGFSSLKEALNEYENRTSVARKALIEEMSKSLVIAKRDPLLHKYGVFAFRPIPVADNTIHINPTLTSPLAADFDGDTMGMHIVITDKARKEAEEKMLPSRNLISPQTYSPIFVPTKEFLYGLWEISRPKTHGDMEYISKENRLKKFKNVLELKRAINEGLVNIKDLVVLENK